MIRQTGGLASGGHLDEVEVQVPGDGQGLGQRLDADLVAVGGDERTSRARIRSLIRGSFVVRCGYAASLLMQVSVPAMHA